MSRFQFVLRVSIPAERHNLRIFAPARSQSDVDSGYNAFPHKSTLRKFGHNEVTVGLIDLYVYCLRTVCSLIVISRAIYSRIRCRRSYVGCASAGALSSGRLTLRITGQRATLPSWQASLWIKRRCNGDS